MQFISEKTINQVLLSLEDEQKYTQLSKSLIVGQPAIIAYLQSESFEILTEEEKDLLWYGVIVITESIHQSLKTIPKIKIKDLEKFEEENYDLAGDNLKYKEMADVFFMDYDQEDLLAFVEDFLVPDENDDTITTVGRKVLFISLKTIIDAYSRF